MIEIKRLTQEGIDNFKAWLSSSEGIQPPGYLLSGSEYTEPAYKTLIDPDLVFSTRYDFGKYLAETFVHIDFEEMMSQRNDGLWAWLSVVYFAQLTAKGKRREEHYVIVRKGLKGSLAYRHAARTSFELVHIHGLNSLVCLSVDISRFGDMAEQLASRQTLAHNRGFFQTAFQLYVNAGKLKKGASSKPKNPKRRKPGDRTGLGGVRRLAVALRRLDLTFDTETMDASSIIGVLPKEFEKWKTTGN